MNLKHYLWIEWCINNVPKYYQYFETWYNNLTPNQISYFMAYMNGGKTPQL